MKPLIVMEVLERACQMEREGTGIIHLEVGEPDFDMPSLASDTAVKAQTHGVTHYTHSLGDPELRVEICNLYKREYGVDVTPDRIVVTSGSSPAILMTLLTLCGAGDEVIISNPGYPCYRNFILAANAVPVDVEVDAANGFLYDINKLKKAITPRTKAIFVNSPMNPSGTLVSDESYKEIVRLGIPIISDEIYHGLIYEGKAHSVLEFTDDAFVLNGFSKRYAMTGLRLGYMIAPHKYMRALQTLQQNLFICAPSTAQKAAVTAMSKCGDTEEDMRTIYNERRLYMIERLRSMGFTIEVEPKGAFYVFADARKFTSDSYSFAFDVLENAHVGITPGVDFGSNGEGFVRFSYANSIDNIKEGLDRLESYLLKNN